MKIERWAVYSKDGKESFGGFATKMTAEDYAAKHGHVAVLLTGELPEPKKKVRMAPALCKGTRNHISQRYYRTAEMFDNEEDARANCKDTFLCWPAPTPNSDGFIEVEVDG